MAYVPSRAVLSAPNIVESHKENVETNDAKMTNAEPKITAVVAQMRREMRLFHHHSTSDLTLEEVAKVGEIIKDEIHDEVEAMAELRKLLEGRDSLDEKQEKFGELRS
ncbi:hypothetical protein PIB30_055635 [Stylosanthes scabra]|uniref:Uncharacterized protein n=1 Tax=Stylosanthes scabra TaxID=79078 RepID=A0ABU6SK19_9FABA|nr:hypothetical protein [Stylosanthes scabra]